MATRAPAIASMDTAAPVRVEVVENEREQPGVHPMAHWILTILLMEVAYQVR